nr:hypothetical protein Iba_chr02dCG8800 [Ipomoea batatas]
MIEVKPIFIALLLLSLSFLVSSSSSDFSLSASSDLQTTKAAEKLSSEVKRKGRTIPVSSGGSAAAAAARPKTKSSSSPHISIFHVYYLLLFSVFSAFLLL